MKGNYILRISYRVRAHEISSFEEIFQEQIMPVIEDRGLSLLGIWKTVVGDVGEFMELWSFESLAEFETEFKALLADPRIQKVFQTTGPMVLEERFTILEPSQIEQGV